MSDIIDVMEYYAKEVAAKKRANLQKEKKELQKELQQMRSEIEHQSQVIDRKNQEIADLKKFIKSRGLIYPDN